MTDPVLREPISPLPYEVAGEAQMPLRGGTGAEELSAWFQRRWDELQDRIEGLRMAYGSGFARELGENARNRIRYYHQRRPLHVLGAIAVATFAFGLLVGLRRRG